MIYDALVIGSGPAGASTAYELALSGAKVLILERAKLPRYKACGGMIPLNFFRTLPVRTQRTQETLLTEGICMGPVRKTLSAVSKVTVAGVMRDRFDHEFTLAAVDHGAELMDSTPVVGVEEQPDRVLVRTRRGSFAGRVLVGADGATGVVKRSLGIGSRNSPAAAMKAELKPGAGTSGRKGILADCGLIRDGYTWIVPKGDLDSVGVFSFGRDRSAVRRKQLEWMSLHGYSAEGEVLHGHPIPLWRGRARFSTRRSLLVGDAADTVDPFLGEGIRYGVISGRVAAAAILSSLRDGGSLEGYTRALYEAVHSDFIYAQWIAALFYRFPGFFFDLWVRSLGGLDLIGQVLYGEIRYRDLFCKAVQVLLRPKSYRRLTSSPPTV